MTTFDTWFSRFMWGTDIVFLAASTPHIAAWYEHFDNPGDVWSGLYAWLVGYGLAIAIDGVSLMLLFALTRMIKQGERSWGVKFGILFFMALIASLSWFINWQYDTEFATNAFSKADSIAVNLFVHSVSIGTLNPIIGGAFSVLIMAYALISKVVKEDEKSVMTDADYEAEKQRLHRERELKELRKNGSQGLLARGKESLLGQEQDALELLEKTLAYLRDARELLSVENEQRAVEALSAYLKIKAKGALPLLIQGRSIIQREEQEALLRQATSDASQDDGQHMRDHSIAHEDLNTGSSREESEAQEDLLRGLAGRDTVSLETAAKALNCQVKYVVTLRNQGKLKHGPKRDDLITVASVRTYLASHKRRNSQETEPIPQLHVVNGYVEEPEQEKLTIAMDALRENPTMTDEVLAKLLSMKRSASARFWRVKAAELLAQERGEQETESLERVATHP